MQLIQQSLEVRNEKGSWKIDSTHFEVSQLESQLSEVKVASKRVGEWCQDYETSLSKNDVNLISIVHVGVKQALKVRVSLHIFHLLTAILYRRETPTALYN